MQIKSFCELFYSKTRPKRLVFSLYVSGISGIPLFHWAGWTDGWMEGWMEGWKDGGMDG